MTGPSLVIGKKRYTRFRRAMYKITIETPSPGGGSFANPIERFPKLRVCHAISLSTLGPKHRGEDGALEPEISLFEPLLDDRYYYLPWNIPVEFRLVDNRKWGGWSAWLGNDHSEITHCSLDFLGVRAKQITVRWTGDAQGQRFRFEGNVEIGPLVMYGSARLDTKQVLKTLFGPLQAKELDIQRERLTASQIPGWTRYILSRKK